MKAAELTPHGLRRYKHGPDEHGTEGRGCRCTDCRKASAADQDFRRRMIAYGRWEQGWVDAAGTQRRLQALMWNGWPMTRLAARLGWTNTVFRLKLHTNKHVAPATAVAVRALYHALWDQSPPERTPQEKRLATIARRYARERGWCPPAAWDDDEIDDPAAVPAPGWDIPLSGAAIRAAREQAGLSQYKLAAAVGLSRSAIQQFENGTLTPGEQHWVQLELTLGPLGVVREAAAGDGGQRQGEEAA